VDLESHLRSPGRCPCFLKNVSAWNVQCDDDSVAPLVTAVRRGSPGRSAKSESFVGPRLWDVLRDRLLGPHDAAHDTRLRIGDTYLHHATDRHSVHVAELTQRSTAPGAANLPLPSIACTWSLLPRLSACCPYITWHLRAWSAILIFFAPTQRRRFFRVQMPCPKRQIRPRWTRWRALTGPGVLDKTRTEYHI